METQSALKKPSEQIDRARKILLVFYQKPIAQISTELFFTIAATIFFALFAIRPTILTMTELVKEIDDKKTTVEALKKKVTALNTVQKEYFVLQNQFYLLEEAIPSEPRLADVVGVIEKVASDLQISITSLQLPELPLKSKTPVDFSKKAVITKNVTVDISGDYLQIKAFINALSGLRPILGVESATINRKTEREEESSITTATIRIQVYYYGEKPKEAEGDGEQSPADPEEEAIL